jgi:hypothetical protein
MYRSDDEGQTWLLISNNSGFPSVQQRITDIEVSPAGSNNVWITLGGFSQGQKVFTSFSSGGSWTNVTGSLPNVPINTIEVDVNGNAYVGTDIGVFYRPSGGDWIPFWNKLPIVPVTDLEMLPADNVIRAATFGRGVWQSDLYSSCSPAILAGGNINGNRILEASDFIISSGIIYGGANTQVTMKAGNYIEFNQGFQVGPGNKFRAYTSPCGVYED